MLRVSCGVALIWLVATTAMAQTQLETVAVTVSAPNAAPTSTGDSASERSIAAQEVQERTVTRSGEVLETVPGLIVTQHSGEGKANQYFLRGFNLDHGTDLALFLDGMPLNMRTHGHGQGYADTNFLIPELLGPIEARKGPYRAEDGDFASAGAVRMQYVDRLDKNLASASIGSFGYQRVLGAASQDIGGGTVLAAGEFTAYRGPWETPDNLRKANAVLRYSQGTQEDGLSLTAMAYTNRWTATDQIPARAVAAGIIGPYGTLDPTDGGDTSRFSLSGRWSRADEVSQTRLEAYAVRSQLNLFNNFTYRLDDPVNGDQFRQFDERTLIGLNARHTLIGELMSRRIETTIGAQTRFDDIRVGLQRTQNRTVLATVRDDAVQQASVGLFAEVKVHWSAWMRTTIGLRLDHMRARVVSDTAANSGQTEATLLSPKFGLVLGPFARTELFFNAGQGFHSNDARGATISVDPVDKVTPLDKVPLLVKSTGGEIGLRTRVIPDVEMSIAAFALGFESENLFVGDAGTTIASRPSQRFGIEWSGRYRPFPWLLLDADVAYTHARFSNDDPVGPYVPGAPTWVASAGVTYGEAFGWFVGARMRYFGARPLIEDGSVQSDPTLVVNARLGYRWRNGMSLQLDGLNLFDARTSQIDYFYASRLAGEPLGGIADRHFHPMEPRSVRLTLVSRF